MGRGRCLDFPAMRTADGVHTLPIYARHLVVPIVRGKEETFARYMNGVNEVGLESLDMLTLGNDGSGVHSFPWSNMRGQEE